MKIFYTASFYGKEAYQAHYDLVRETLESMSAIEVFGTESGNYQEFLSPRLKNKLSKDPELLHYEAIRQGIAAAEAVVMEVSHEDIQLGHEASLAMTGKKPVLCLSVHRDLSRKIRHPYFFGAQYQKGQVKGVLEEFIRQVKAMSKTERFNMFLYKHQLEYLKQVSEREGMTMSEYVRRLLSFDRQLRE